MQRNGRWLSVAVTVLAATLAGCASGPRAGERAALEVQTDEVMEARVLDQGIELHTNRPFAFGQVPQEFQDLTFVAWPARMPWWMQVRARDAGEAYLALEPQAELPPQLRGSRPVGTLPVRDLGRGIDSLEVYRVPMEAGERFTIDYNGAFGEGVFVIGRRIDVRSQGEIR